MKQKKIIQPAKTIFFVWNRANKKERQANQQSVIRFLLFHFSSSSFLSYKINLVFIISDLNSVQSHKITDKSDKRTEEEVEEEEKSYCCVKSFFLLFFVWMAFKKNCHHLQTFNK